MSQWADRHRVLSSDISAEPGPWRTDRVPYTREIMDVLSPSDPCQEATFVAGTQVAKTETGNNFLGFVMDWAPGPAMVVLPTSNTAKRSSKTRLSRMIDSTPSLRRKVSERQRDGSNSSTLKDFPGGVLAIAGANSAAELKSMPVRYLFEDEIDEYPDDVDGQGPADELAEKRTDTFVRKKIFRTSTPTIKGRSKVWKHYERSDQREYHVPCPHCQAPQTLVRTQLRWETRKVWEVIRADDGEIVEVAPGTEGAEVRDTGDIVDVFYECIACSMRIDEHHKTQMLAAGRWIARHPERPRRGYHLNTLYSPLGWFSWRQVVEKVLEADKDPTGALLKVVVNTIDALPYAETGEQPDGHEIQKRVEAYKLGTVPMGGLFLSAGADVQANRIEVAVKAWGREEESWLVDYQVIFGDTETSAPWDALDEFLQRKYPHACGAKLPILAAGIDAGYRTQTVYGFTRKRAHRHIFALKGQAESGKTVLGRPKKQDVDHRGQVIKDGVELWPIGTDTAKSKIYARLKIEMPGPGCLHFPLGLPDEYFAQLTAERLVTRYHRGYLKRVWEKDAGARNEALDLEVYAYAAALFAGLTRVNWDKLEAALRATAGDLFVDAEARAAKDNGQVNPEGGEDAAGGPDTPAAEPRVQTPAPPPAARRVRRGAFVNRWRG